MILLGDEHNAVQAERENHDKPVLSSNVRFAKDIPLPKYIRAQTSNLLLSKLKDTTEKDLTRAVDAGFAGFTLESLEALRDKIVRLGQEEMDLLLELTWQKSAPQLSRRLSLIRDGQED